MATEQLTKEVAVFGTPITADQYPSEQERAKKALQVKNAVLKEADDFLNQQVGGAAAAVPQVKGAAQSDLQGIVYNATAHDVTFVRKYEWHGKIVKYPMTIKPGQGAVFRCVPTGPFECEGALVYRAIDADNKTVYWIFAWQNPNHAYTELAESLPDDPEEIKTKLEASPSRDDDERGGLRVDVQITGTPGSSTTKYCASIQ